MDFQYYFNYWLLQSVAMAATALLIPKLRITGITGLLFAVIGIALVNSFLWDAALFFHIPDSFTTRTVLLLLTNGAIFWILAKLLPGIEIEGVLPAIAAPVVFTCCSVFIAAHAKDVNWQQAFELTSKTTETVFAALKNYFKH